MGEISSTGRRERRFGLLAIVVVLAIGVAVALAAAPIVSSRLTAGRRDHPAAAAIGRLLTTMQSRSTDASDYAPFFEQPSLAEQLAAEAREATPGAFPRWRAPYVSSRRDGEVDVVVVWEAKGVATTASLFVLRERSGTWLVVDGRTYGADERVPPPD